ncbi:MAG: hypothetical protein FD121_1631, partial [Gallionellaceae bacterium]
DSGRMLSLETEGQLSREEIDTLRRFQEESLPLPVPPITTSIHNKPSSGYSTIGSRPNETQNGDSRHVSLATRASNRLITEAHFEQDTDPDLALVRKWCDEGWPTKREVAKYSDDCRAYHALRHSIALMQGKLHYIIEDDPPRVRILVPFDSRKTVIANAHDQSGHYGRKKTLRLLHERFWWPQAERDVKLYVRMCDLCQRSKKFGFKKAPMQLFEVGSPNQVVAIDLVGPLNRTARQHRYVLTMIDHFTRTVAFGASSSCTAEKAIEMFFDRWVSVYGMPESIHSDQGTHFENTIMDGLCEYWNVRKTRTTAYRPSANGLCERANRSLKETLTRLLQQHSEDWDELLPKVQISLNSVEHETTEYSPFELTFGRKMRLPIDLLLDNPPTRTTHAEWVEKLIKRLEVAFRFARDTMHGKQARSKRRYDVGTRQTIFEIGDQVFYLKPVLDNKFASPCTGPCTITHSYNDVNVRIVHNEQSWTKIVHTDRLKHAYSEGDTDNPVQLDNSTLEHTTPNTGNFRPADSGIADSRESEMQRTNVGQSPKTLTDR